MMDRDISVDILLPTYNGEIYIKDQIESILNQSHSNLRLIIRDDGSKDNTINIIKDFQSKDNRVVLIESKEGNLGLVKSIEKLLMISDAEVIFFSDQDDYWIKNKIEIFIQHYNTSEQPILIHSNCYVTDNELNIKGDFIQDISKNKGLKDSLFNYFVQGSSAMINKKLKEHLLPFPDDVYVHDRYFHIISEIIGERIYISRSTMYYRQHGGNLIGSGSFLQKIKRNLKLKKFYLIEDKKLIQKISEKFPDNKLLQLYKVLTSEENSRLKKLRILKENNISLRLKEKILLLLKN